MDGITTEAFKAHGNNLNQPLCLLLKFLWHLEKVFIRWKQAIGIPSLKKKGNSCECKRHNPSINHWKGLYENHPAMLPETVEIVETINYRIADQFLPKLRMP